MGRDASADAMGLFWSMQPEPADAGVPPPPPPDIRAPIVTTFDVEAGGQTVASAMYKRWWRKPGIRVSDVREQGLPAALSTGTGGTPEGTAAATADAIPRMLTFLERNLARR